MYNLLPEDIAGGSLEGRQSLAAQMLPLFLLSEDLPAVENRVTLDDQQRVVLTHQPTNVPTHERFIRVVTQKLKDAGYGEVTHKSFLHITDGGGYHHCGTVRFGNDPATSVLDRNCRAHDVDNLYVVDTCCFPSNPSLNPVLTIIANALRVAEHIKTSL
jgi:choline dehydrogenase-like flavoprotein